MIRGYRESRLWTDHYCKNIQQNHSAVFKRTPIPVQLGTRRRTGSVMLSDKCIENLRAPVLSRYHNILERFIDHTLSMTRV